MEPAERAVPHWEEEGTILEVERQQTDEALDLQVQMLWSFPIPHSNDYDWIIHLHLFTNCIEINI